MTASAAAQNAIPPGFAEMPPVSGFGRAMGPWYRKIDGERVVLGIRAEERHLNRLGIIHGGMMMAFADTLLGEVGRRVTGRQSVTMRMTVDFVSAAKLGDWIEGTGEVARSTRNLVFVRARIWRGRHTLMTASGVFNFIRPRDAAGRPLPAEGRE
ncbi:MAG: PaaI family thioesterase [Reyranellaceae bacterium]